MKLTEEELKKILLIYHKLCNAIDAAKSAGVLDPNGEFYNTIWFGFDEMLQIIDPHGWLMWFIYDNNVGGNELAAEVGSKIVKVKNMKTLLEVMNA